MSFITISGLAVLLLQLASGFHLRKEVTNLPGLPKGVKFRQYSGYLNASATHFLHYWFVESQNDPKKDPVLLWMNGGPGCSSLDGFLSELGPFKVNPDGATLLMNPYAWNRNANIIFLEAPAGVGFSYSSDGDVTTDDDQTSAENYAALQHFFAIFKEFRKNEFYITGESYAGIYIPTLAQRVVLGMRDFPLNFKGIAIGNGMLDFELNADTIIQFAYNHALVTERQWNFLEQVCCKGCTDECKFHELRTKECNNTVTEIMHDVYDLGLNMYDLYRDCYNNSPQHYPRFMHDVKRFFPRHAHVLTKMYKNYPENDVTVMSKSLKKGQNSSPPCMNITAVTTYLQRQDVREALHIPDYVQKWTMCSTKVEEGYKTTYQNMYDQIRMLFGRHLKLLIYNGDTDMACNFLMNEKFVSNLGSPLVLPQEIWKVNGQIAGYATMYKDIVFVTVKGTGHMVPQWKPAQAYTMITKFLNQKFYKNFMFDYE